MCSLAVVQGESLGRNALDMVPRERALPLGRAGFARSPAGLLVELRHVNEVPHGQIQLVVLGCRVCVEHLDRLRQRNRLGCLGR